MHGRAVNPGKSKEQAAGACGGASRMGCLDVGQGSPDGTWLRGHRTRLVTTLIYGLSGLTAALAGVILSSQVHTGSATYGEFGTELDVIAAVVLGGTQLTGGRGSVARTVVGCCAWAH